MPGGPTTRLRLILGLDNDTVDVDNFLDVNFNNMELYLPNFLCTSATRPSAPFAGEYIYEADTGYLRMWNGVSLRWDALNIKQVLSTDARPNTALLGDRLFETDTAITRIWDGTRFKPLGAGNIYYAQYAGASFDAVANPRANIPIQTFSTDGVTPYSLQYVSPGWFCTAGPVLASDALDVSIDYSINGGTSWVPIDFALSILGTATTGKVAFGPSLYVPRFTPPQAANTQFRVSLSLGNAAGGSYSIYGTNGYSWLNIAEL